MSNNKGMILLEALLAFFIVCTLISSLSFLVFGYRKMEIIDQGGNFDDTLKEAYEIE